MPSFAFKIADGQVHGRESLWTAIKGVFAGLPDGEYIWQHPEKRKQIRSLQQNAYYHSVICKLISEHTGYEHEEMHQILAEMFLSYEKDGRSFTRSTTKLKTSEFEDYLERCRRWAAMELQVYCPLPNEPNNFYYQLPDKAAS